jgi:NADH dehydrogenase FAD-containing subunit
MEKAKIVVLGGGFAGILAARRLARRTRDRADVLLLSASDSFVERVRLHELAARGTIQALPLPELCARAGVGFLAARATAIDAAARRITCADGTSVPYDHLIYALGSAVDLAAAPGAAEHAHSVADEAAARRLAAALAALPDGARVVVCGGGMTGVEVATEVAEAHGRLRVRLVTRDPPCEPLCPRARAYLATALARRGIEVTVGAAAREVRADALVTDEGTIPFDLCVWAASFAVSPLAREAGLAVHPRGQLAVDEQLRSSSHPEVWGAGDAALPTCNVPIRMGCATAMPMAAHAADNLAALLRGRRLRPFRFAYLVRFISLGRRDALAQPTRADDSPRRMRLTGRLAAWLKEMTFRFNLRALRTGFYPWRLVAFFL